VIADSVPAVMLFADRFVTVIAEQSNVPPEILVADNEPVWIFDAVRSPVMILPPEMMVASQLKAPIALRVARVPCPAIAAAVCVDV